MLGDISVKLHKCSFEVTSHNFQPGAIIDNKLTIAVKDGLIKPLLIQKAGKNLMSIEEFLRGNTIKLGSIVT